MKSNDLIIKYWSESMQVGLQDVRTCIGLINGEVVKFKTETCNGSLRYRHNKIVVPYKKLKSTFTHKNFTLKQYLPF